MLVCVYLTQLKGKNHLLQFSPESDTDDSPAHILFIPAQVPTLSDIKKKK